MKAVALYLRVSTKEQTTENQRREIEAIAARSGWHIVAIYEDAGISGAKGRDKRPGFDRLLKDAARRKFDMIAAWSVDRLGRSLRDLVAFLEDLRDLKIDLFLHQQGLDTSTSSGRMMFQLISVFAEFERAMIRERVNAGLARAKAQGKVLGRRRTSRTVESKILELRAQKQGIVRIAKALRIGVSVVQRVIGKAEQSAQIA